MKFVIGLLTMLCINVAHATAPQGLSVSTYPLYLIAKAVTASIEHPHLLLTANQSGHDAQLTPSNRQQIQKSTLIVWLGPQHETPLQPILNQHPQAIAILQSPLLKLKAQRDVHGTAIPSSVDSHVWLEPSYAERIAFFIAALRGQQYPKYKSIYFSNALNFSQRLRRVTQNVQQQSSSKTYWAYHDAYQYLERALKLQFKGALTADEDLSPTAAQLKYLMDQPRVDCLIAEHTPQAQLVRRLNPKGVVVFDESFSQVKDFVEGWQSIAHQVQSCGR